MHSFYGLVFYWFLFVLAIDLFLQIESSIEDSVGMSSCPCDYVHIDIYIHIQVDIYTSLCMCINTYTHIQISVCIREEKVCLYPLRFSVWRPSSLNWQISDRKEIFVHVSMCMEVHRKIWLRGVVRIWGLFTILIGKSKRKKGTYGKQMTS